MDIFKINNADAAIAKITAIKNIRKSPTARILKRLNDGQPFVNVARKMRAIKGMQPQINDMENKGRLRKYLALGSPTKWLPQE